MVRLSDASSDALNSQQNTCSAIAGSGIRARQTECMKLLASRLFWKIFSAYVVLTLISAAVFVMILSARERRVIVQRVEQRLHDLAIVLRDETARDFGRASVGELQSKLESIAEQTGTRITLVGAEGTVFGDSAKDPALMENHRSRPELLEARQDGMGKSERRSPTLGIPMLYFAVRVGPRETPRGFVRVAMSMRSVNAQVMSTQHLILGTATIVGLIALAFTYFVVGRIIRPLTTLTHAAQMIADGKLDFEVKVPGHDELGTLASAFNSMSHQLAARIDELQRQGRELAENNERLETVLAGMVEGVIAIDNEERVLLANEAARAMLDFPVPAIAHRPIWEAVCNPMLQQVVRQAMQSTMPQRVEFEVPRTQSVIALLAARLPGDPCPGVVLVLHDVTDLRRLENIRREFVSNVSHELKTPLTSIQAYTETLLEGAIDDPDHNRAFLQRVQDQAERLHALILDLLQLARIESGKDVLELTSVPVAELVAACVRQRIAVCESKQLNLATQPADEPLHVLADAEGLRTILDNLVDNAINYTPPSGEVIITWTRQESLVELNVRDTGVGIADEHLGRIFERFYRVDKARSQEVGGTGLGLSIVKHLVQEFNGTVEVTSQLGVGSTFTVRLPLVAAPNDFP